VLHALAVWLLADWLGCLVLWCWLAGAGGWLLELAATATATHPLVQPKPTAANIQHQIYLLRFLEADLIGNNKN